MRNIAILLEELAQKMAQLGRNGVDLGVRIKKRRIFLASNQSEHINKLLVAVKVRYFGLFELRVELVLEVEVGLGHVGVRAPITTIDQLEPVPFGFVVLPQDLEGRLQVDLPVAGEELGPLLLAVVDVLGVFSLIIHHNNPDITP